MRRAWRGGSPAVRENQQSFNAQFSSEGLCVYEDVSLGMMVARRDGVLVPAVQKTVGTLAAEGAELSRQAHAGKVHRHKQRRPTFTVIDLSGYAVDSFTPILPARSAGIVGIGRADRRYRPGPATGNPARGRCRRSASPSTTALPTGCTPRGF